MKEKSYKDRIKHYATMSVIDFLKELAIPSVGLNKKQVEESRNNYGWNCTADNDKYSILKIFFRSFFTPFSIILFILGIISLFTEILFPESEHSSYSTVIIILSMVFLSGIIRFIQEINNKKVSDSITKYINSKTDVYRDGNWIKIDSEEVVVGDYIRLKTGDRVPADTRLTKSENCYVSQSVITGESRIIQKDCQPLSEIPLNITDYKNTIFLGTSITSGECEGIVIAVGKESVYGLVSIENSDRKKGFDKGANSIAIVLIKFMLFLIPVVFLASGITSHNWLTAFLFALSVAVGLTPELLPMVITACLGKGAFYMKQKQTIVKNVNAMQGFGSIDVLCVDKTGTLTGDKLIPEYYMDIFGNENREVLDMAYLNSYYHVGLENHIDNAILNIKDLLCQEDYFENLTSGYRLYRELPFDYSKKFSSVIVENVNTHKYLLVTKGDVESVIKNCTSISYKNNLYNIDNDQKQEKNEVVDDLTEDGMKVIAIAVKEINKDDDVKTWENGLTLLGYIGFLDAPKTSAKSAIEKLKNLNVNVKVLTGDNKDTSISVCRRLGLNTDKIITGREFDLLNDNDVQNVIEDTVIFAELLPKQKAQIVSLLKSNGHKVGFLGDGMNDLSAIMEADVGISIDTAATGVKEVADVVLLKKDLNVLEEGILEGRKAFANMNKYIKITASSNLGNIFGIVIASLILPFFPMTSIQILLLNLLYDILCLSLPWDNVDEELYKKPLEWSGRKLSGFMMFFGPLSVIFDVITFAFMLFVLCPFMAGGQFHNISLAAQDYYISVFQTGWFLESMWTQVLIIQLLRTGKLPFIQSKSSKTLLIVTVVGITFFTILSLTPVGGLFGFTRLPVIYFVFLVLIVIFYLLFMTLAKKLYLKHHESLL